MSIVDTKLPTKESEQARRILLVNLHEIVGAMKSVMKKIIKCNKFIQKLIKELEHYNWKIGKLENSINKQKRNKINTQLKKAKNVSRDKKKPHAYNNYIRAVVKEGFPKVRIEFFLNIFYVSYMRMNYNLIRFQTDTFFLIMSGIHEGCRDHMAKLRSG